MCNLYNGFYIIPGMIQLLIPWGIVTNLRFQIFLPL
jgi:hypothetical protein